MAVTTVQGRLESDDAADLVAGGAGNDTLLGGAGNDTLNGGDGFDFAVYWTSGAPIGVQLFRGIVDDGFGGTDTLSNIEGIIGSAWSDIILGSGLTDVLLGLDGNDTIQGLDGDDVLNGNGGDDQIVGGAGSDTVYGDLNRADYTITAVDGGFRMVANTGGEGDDLVTEVEFFAFADGVFSAASIADPNAPPVTPGGGGGGGGGGTTTIRGTAGDDVLAHGSGQRAYEGLGGQDALDMGKIGFRAVDTSAQADGALVVTHGGDQGVVRGVEVVRFADGRLVLDENDAAARVTRLYEAALDRVADQGGLNFWIDAVQDGRSLSELAQGFLASGEFQARFGGAGTSNAAFVDQLYQNVLGRAGEGGGRDFWVGSLNSGTSRADVLVAFSESAENKAGTAALVQNGIWDRSEAATEVARLYDTVFGRKADVDGLSFWKNALEGGTATLGQMADAFCASAEFRAQYGTLGNRDFANALYVNTLDRPADQAGLNYWAGQLDAGVARSAVVLAFSESQEHVNLTANDIQSENPGGFGILFA